MQLLAETLRKRGYHARAVAFNTDFRNYSTDQKVLSGKLPLQRFWFALQAVFQYDVFHFFWGVSLFDFWRFTGLDLPVLRLMNKTIIVHFRGTDLIDINYYNYLNARARGEVIKEPARSRPDQLARLAQWRKYADHLLVSTPDLLSIVPEATLVPQVIDVKAMEPYRKVTTNRMFRLGHAPTRRSTKGTEFIIQAVNNLRSRGHAIELDLIEGETPDGVLSRFSLCDAGIDQLLHGWYGKVSVELMAIGKPVLCYLDPVLSRLISPPIISASRESLESIILTVVSNRNYDPQPGIVFVQEHHDVNHVVNKLLDLYKVDD